MASISFLRYAGVASVDAPLMRLDLLHSIALSCIELCRMDVLYSRNGTAHSTTSSDHRYTARIELKWH